MMPDIDDMWDDEEDIAPFVKPRAPVAKTRAEEAMTPDTPADGEALALKALFDAWQAAAHAPIDAFDPASVIRASEAFTAELIDQYANGALIPRPAEPAPADVAAQLAKLRETFCLASPGSDEGFTAWLEGFDAAVAIISATQEART